MAYAKWTALTCSHEQNSHGGWRDYIEGIKAHRNEQDNVVVVSVVDRKEVENDTDVASPILTVSPMGTGEVVELIEKCAKSTGWGIFYF